MDEGQLEALDKTQAALVGNFTDVLPSRQVTPKPASKSGNTEGEGQDVDDDNYNEQRKCNSSLIATTWTPSVVTVSLK